MKTNKQTEKNSMEKIKSWIKKPKKMKTYNRNGIIWSK